MVVFHADALKAGQDLRESVCQRADCVEFFLTELTPVMGAHTGPGMVGPAFYME